MRRPCLMSAFAVLFLSAVVRGEPPGRVDAYGDPLPAGVVARFGTVRFRSGQGTRWALLSPDAKTVATSNYRGMLLWDLATGRLRRQLTDYGEELAFSPDGRTVAVIDFRTEALDAPWHIRLLDADTGKELRVLEWTARRADQIVFSADGRRISAASQLASGEDSVQVWDVATGRAFGPFNGEQLGRLYPVLSPDGRTLVTWGRGVEAGESETDLRRRSATVQLWEVATGKERGRIVAEEPDVRGVAYSPDGHTLAVAAGDRISLWDTGTFRRRASCRTREGLGFSLTFAPDGQTLAARSSEGIVQEWDAVDGRRRGTFAGPKWSVSNLVYSPEGRLLIGGWIGEVPLVWDVHSGRALTPSERHAEIERLSFVKDGTVLSVVSDSVRAEFWDVTERKERCRVTLDDMDRQRAQGCHDVELRDLTAASNGKYVFVAFAGKVHMRDVPAGEDVCLLPKALTARRLCLSPDGERVAAVQQDEITIWNAESGEITQTIALNASGSRCLAFSPDGKFLALGGRGGIDLCDAVKGQVLRWLRSENEVIALAFSPDGKSLAVHEKEGGLHLWDAATGKRLRSFEEFAGKYTSSPVFTPEGRCLVCAGQDGEADGIILIWEVATGRLRRQLHGHRGQVTALAVSPHGKLLASGGSDTTVLLWDLAASMK